MDQKQANSSKTMVLAALIGNGLIMLTKFVVAALSGSVAMLAEAVHSVADTFNQIFLLISLKTGAKPADEEHPFGHGKERFFWAFLTAIVIFFVGAFFSIYEGIKKISETSHSIDDSHFMISMITLGAALIFESVAMSFAIREVRHGMKATKKGLREFISETKDLTVKTVIFEDGAAMLGLIVAGTGLYMSKITGNLFYDGLASIIIGLVLAVVAIYLAVGSRNLLIGHAASKEELSIIRKAILDEPSVSSINDLLTMHMSPEEILVTTHLTLMKKVKTEELLELIDRIELNIRKSCPNVKRIFIEPQYLV